MAKKKNITKNDIISWYMEYVLENDEQPKSVFSFAKANNFEESLFYQHFGSFDGVVYTRCNQFGPFVELGRCLLKNFV